jgi:hypothetical protein
MPPLAFVCARCPAPASVVRANFVRVHVCRYQALKNITISIKPGAAMGLAAPALPLPPPPAPPPPLLGVVVIAAAAAASTTVLVLVIVAKCRHRSRSQELLRELQPEQEGSK